MKNQAHHQTQTLHLGLKKTGVELMKRPRHSKMMEQGLAKAKSQIGLKRIDWQQQTGYWT
jgi:hypothetical protein